MTLEVPKPTESEVARAECGIAAAREARTTRKWDDLLERPFKAEEEVAEGSDDSAPVRHVRAVAGGQSVVQTLSLLFFEHVPTPTEAAWALDQIIKAEDEAEKVKRRAEAQIERAERRARWIREMLWPALVRYTETAPRSTKKGWKFPDTDARLTMRDSPGRVTVKDRGEALKWAKSQIGMDQAIEREIIRVREELSEAKLRDWIEESVDRKGYVLGIEYEPAGERLTLYRR